MKPNKKKAKLTVVFDNEELEKQLDAEAGDLIRSYAKDLMRHQGQRLCQEIKNQDPLDPKEVPDLAKISVKDYPGILNLNPNCMLWTVAGDFPSIVVANGKEWAVAVRKGDLKLAKRILELQYGPDHESTTCPCEFCEAARDKHGSQYLGNRAWKIARGVEVGLQKWKGGDKQISLKFT